MPTLSSSTGITPAATMVSAPSAHSSSSSSDAYWYTKVASVSKLKGRRIRVRGSSFMVSTNTSRAAAITLGRTSGRCMRHRVAAGPCPRVRAAPSIEGVTLEKLASIGRYPSAMKRAT